MKTYVVDIDDTLLVSKKITCRNCSRTIYTYPEPIKEEIRVLKKLYKKGHRIILHTGRGWDCYETTVYQLKSLKIKYHELIMGKPQGVYVDKDAIRTLTLEV